MAIETSIETIDAAGIVWLRDTLKVMLTLAENSAGDVEGIGPAAHDFSLGMVHAYTTALDLLGVAVNP